ncbi:hypothetical protein [Cytobacillus horneckiae]|uniref:hypothetical protein n=1 Tax=Cytobacillus horneckiae TaxID=549687 RepID=UPI003D9A815E
MFYEVINDFVDLEDNKTYYKVGERYPKGKLKPTKKRIKELTTEYKKYKKVFIKEIEELSEE